MKKKIIFSAGGTGGHILPAINLMKYLFDKGYEVLIVTDTRGFNYIKNNSEFKSYLLNTATPTNKNLFHKIIPSLLIFYSIIKSIFILKKERPNLIFGCGGYVSFPISFASIFFKIPLVIYDNNMILGRANKYLLSFSKKIFLAKDNVLNFPEKYKYKSYEVGHILSKNITNYQNHKRENSKKEISLLILGGSQGAEIFGEIIPPVIKMIKDKGYEIKISQQCLSKQEESIKKIYEKNEIKNYIFHFEKNILKLISDADFAITRCGASTIAELTHTQTPFIGVPLPNSIDNHQYLNAKYYENKGCCWILEQKIFNTHNLFNLIMGIIKNKNKLELARENMKKNYKNDVYSHIEKEIKELLNYEN